MKRSVPDVARIYYQELSEKQQTIWYIWLIIVPKHNFYTKKNIYKQGQTVQKLQIAAFWDM